MDQINQVIEKAKAVLTDEAKLAEVRLPALREVLKHVATSDTREFAYKKHSDHSKTSTGGCVMGCIGG